MDLRGNFEGSLAWQCDRLVIQLFYRPREGKRGEKLRENFMGLFLGRGSNSSMEIKGKGSGEEVRGRKQR